MSKFKFMSEDAPRGTTTFDAVGLTEAEWDALEAEIPNEAINEALNTGKTHLLIKAVDSMSSGAKSIMIAILIIKSLEEKDSLAKVMAMLGED